jgi:opacity protein-like surface antigen
MGTAHRSNWARAFRAGILIAAAALFSRAPAHAQGSVAGFAIPGAYFPAGAEARDALGNVLYYREGTLFGFALPLVAARVSAGVDLVSASTRFVPFTGGDEFALIGPGLRVALTPPGRFRPFASVGAYAGHLRSDGRDINTWKFTPSATAGLDIRLTTALWLRAQYRVSEEIGGVSTDGFAVSVRLF